MYGQRVDSGATVTNGLSAQVRVDSQRRLIVTPDGGVTPIGGGDTWTDKTITSLSGSSQTLIAANANRRGLLIKNGAANVGVNVLGTTAAIGGAATMTLAPYEGLAIIGTETPVTLITVIGTAANYVSAFELT